jgi:peroxiredoxin
MRVRPLLPALFLAAIAAVGASASRAFADDAAALEAKVVDAERDPSQLPAVRKAVDVAVQADLKSTALRLLSARVSIAEAAAAKGDKKDFYEKALQQLDFVAREAPRDARPYEFKVKVFTLMSGPSSDIQEALRAFAIRRPGDAVAREAYKRQAGKVPPLKIGDPMPEVHWKDAAGADFPASKLTAGGKVVVLELYRSSVWCPYCAKRIAELHDAADEIRTEGADLYAASPETVERLVEIDKDGFKAPGGVKKPLKVKLLVDPKGDAADALGVLNPETVTPGTSADRFGLPFPTTIVLDKDGFVVFVDTHSDFKDRTKVPEIIAAVKRAARK